MHKLQVVQIEKTIEEATVLSFELPENLREEFVYKPGQFLTLQFELNGETVRRSYSLCSSPLDKHLQVGVKRVKNGLVSNHINDHIKVGDFIDVLPPDGRFYADIDESNYKTYYLFGAGSGITPMLSILKTVLKTEPKSFVNLIYGNKQHNSIMFKKQLDELQDQYPNRLVVVHTLSGTKRTMSDLWSNKEETGHRKGRVDRAAIEWFINTYPPYAQNAEYFICGPGKMIENTEKVLRSLDVPKERIFTERFGASNKQTNEKAVANAKLIASLNGQTIETQIAEGKTVLRALLDADQEPPYSCEGGVCSTCKCQLIQGKVHMKVNLALTDKEVDNGFILSCQSLPLTEVVEVKY